MTTATVTNPLASLALDPRRYWLRAHQRAIARVQRLSAVYEHAWRSGQPAIDQWHELAIARHRERFTYQMLCCVMGWR